MVSLQRKTNGTDNGNDREHDGEELKKSRTGQFSTDAVDDDDISFFSMKRKFRSNGSTTDSGSVLWKSGIASSSAADSGAASADLELSSDDELSDNLEDTKVTTTQTSDKPVDTAKDFHQKVSLNHNLDGNDDSSDVEVISEDPPRHKEAPSKDTLGARKQEQDINAIVLSDGSDTDDIETQLDPEITRKIKEREEQLRSQSSTDTFSVGLVIRTRIPEIASQVVVSKILNDVPFRNVRESYIKELAGRGAFKKARWLKEVLSADAVFVWKSIKVFDFATPQLLRVKRSAPSMVVEIMLEEQFKQMEAEAEQKSYEDLEDDMTDDIGVTEGVAVELNEEQEQTYNAEDDYFRISMNGEDNVAVKVKVNSDTLISKLIAFYRAQKGLSDDEVIRLEFDDEPLDPNGTVGDTELEEDFTVDVYVN